MPLPSKTKGRNQRIGNTGLYYVAYRFSKLGWNVAVTTRNTAGPDLLIYRSGDEKAMTVQVKTVSGENVVWCESKEQMVEHYWVVCRLRSDMQEPEVLWMDKESARRIWSECNPPSRKHRDFKNKVLRRDAKKLDDFPPP